MLDSRGAQIIPFPRGSCAFLVRIEYREPTYELVRNLKPRVYSWTCRVHGRSCEHAEQLGLAEFRRMAALSSVGWVREIVGISARRA